MKRSVKFGNQKTQHFVKERNVYSCGLHDQQPMVLLPAKAVSDERAQPNFFGQKRILHIICDCCGRMIDKMKPD